MQHSPRIFDGRQGEDLFFLKPHISPVWYSVLPEAAIFRF